MPLTKISVYEIEITGHLTIQAENDSQALEAAEGFVLGYPKVLNYAVAKHDGYQWTEPPSP